MSNAKSLVKAFTATVGLILVVGAITASAQTSQFVSMMRNARVFFTDGTSTAPSMTFASETTLGFYRSGAATVTLAGTFISGTINAGATNFLGWASRSTMQSTASGAINMLRADAVTGVQLKFDALPTVGSGFGSSPAVTAGSTPMAGSVNVGTGGTATSGVITFGGTAFPSAPFCTANVVTTTAGNVRAMGTSATTTALTLTAATAWVASDLVSWTCISSK